MSASGSKASIVLDTSAYSRFRAGHEGVLDRIASAPVVIVPTIVLGELAAGFLLGRRQRDNERALEDFLEEPFVTVMPVSADVARSYGGLFAALRRRGTPIPVNDVWIAACALCANATVVTFDRDFEAVPGLEVDLLAAAPAP